MNLAFPQVWDNTQLSAYRRCPRRFFYEFIWNKVGDDTNVHLHAGGAFAKGLEVTRMEYFTNKRPLDESLALGGLALIKFYGDFTPRDTNDNKSLPMMLGALGYYFERWPIDQFIVPAEIGGKPAIEFSFAVPFPKVKHPDTGQPITICGRFDMIAQAGSILLGEDDKTASMLGTQWLNKWRVGNQITTYCWGAKQYGIPLQGFNIRGIGLYKRGYEGVDAITYRKAWQLEEWERNTEATLNDAIRDYQRGYWSANWADACNSFSGCPYLMLCESAEPEQWLKVNFKDRTWNPLQSRD
jgi:hypothetical protein